MNQTLNHVELSRAKEDTIDILFKGLKRKVSHTSYSKIKNSYKKKPIQTQLVSTPFTLNLINRPKLKISIISNRVTDPQQAHDDMIKLKQANHKLFEQNSELIRKIRKQQKIEEIYKKKLSGKQLYELDYLRALEIKLLLQVQTLENQLEQKEFLYQQKMSYLKTKKNSFADQILQSRMQIYQLMIDSPEDLAKIQKVKKSQLKQKELAYHKVQDQICKTKHDKNIKNQTLNKIRHEIKEVKETFKSVQATSKKDKISSEMVNITSLMSSLMNSQKFQTNKQASSTILKNNVSSISVKNRNNIEQIEKQITKIKEEYEMYNKEIQQFMDETIKKKILIYKQIHEIEEKEKALREMENRKSWNKKEGPIVLTKLERSTNPLKNPIVMGIYS